MSINDDQELISFEVEDFHVIDECLEDDEPIAASINQQSDAENCENSKTEETKKMTGDIDFTADISFDQLNDQDVMEHLNEIENIVLDAESFGLENIIEADDLKIDDKKTNDNDDCPDVILLEPDKSDDPEILEADNIDAKKEENVESGEYKWYEERLNKKVTIVKERLSKLSRVLEYSYPCYKNWLDHQASINSTAVCKLDPPRRCPLDRPYTNRWKFLCTRRRTKESEDIKDTNEDDKVDVKTIDKIIKTEWRLAQSGDSLVNADNALQPTPTFVLHAVKIFEEYINTTLQNKDETSDNDKKPAIADNKDDDKDKDDAKEHWLWLLVRSNSSDELMLFATGKNITRGRMDGLKQLYESGDGKDCKVKSLYCKTTSKVDNVPIPQTIFLFGAEALDETVGGLKIQLAPKTNFWSNTIGAEQLGKTVQDFLNPNQKTTVIEVGCGLGLICLMLASKCQRVIGLDSQSEVEEAEMTCELNSIKNASFVIGDSTEVMMTIAKSVINCRTSAVINANTGVARKIDVIWGLRKIPSLTRLVMVTTLTKQSIRSILELTNPTIENLGNPFIPIKAVVVDTLPAGQHFEVVILMERRTVQKLMNPKGKSSPTKSTASTASKSERSVKSDKSKQQRPTKLSTTKGVAAIKKPGSLKKNQKPNDKSIVKNPFHEKTSNWRQSKSIKKRPPKSNQSKPQKRSHDHCEKFAIAVPTKLPRLLNDPNDLRLRLCNNRNEIDLVQKVKEQQKILEVAKQKLMSPSVDPMTSRQLNEILNLALEQSNQIKNQLPRSVWDRIAPVDNSPMHGRMNDVALRGSYVQEKNNSDIIITTVNRECHVNDLPRKYSNVPPVSPNQLIPYDHLHNERKQNQRNKPDRSIPSLFSRRSSPRRHSDGPSPKRPLLSPPRRPQSPPRRHYPQAQDFRRQSRLPANGRQLSPLLNSSPRRQLSPPRLPMSPPRHQVASPRKDYDDQRRLGLMQNDLRRQSPMRQMPTVAPLLGMDDWDIPSRGAIEQGNWQRNERRNEWNFQAQDNNLKNWEAGRNEEWKKGLNLGENRWTVNDSWNIRSKETFVGSQSKPWDGENRWSGDNKGWGQQAKDGKEDWNDLPEDARDPWDDGGNKDRWSGPGNRQGDGQWAQGGMQDRRWQGAQANQNWRSNDSRPGFSGGFQGRGFGGFNDGR